MPIVARWNARAAPVKSLTPDPCLHQDHPYPAGRWRRDRRPVSRDALPSIPAPGGDRSTYRKPAILGFDVRPTDCHYRPQLFFARRWAGNRHRGDSRDQANPAQSAAIAAALGAANEIRAVVLARSRSHYLDVEAFPLRVGDAAAEAGRIVTFGIK